MKIQPRRILYNLKTKAVEYYNNPQKLKALLESTNLTIKDNTQLANLIEDIQAMVSLVMDYTKKRYRSVSKTTIITIIAGLLYLVNPMDLIPDFFVGGFIYDAAVIGYVLTSIKDELDRYKEWKQI
ncbi:MAG: DUF1232 domain-containing protein [Tissierellia bacterium]|nr:DUF1232 domain-containing protein [Tissierellia bacterium]